MTPDSLVQAIAEWARNDDRISAVALCGSYARGTATADSDIDICLICPEPQQLIDDLSWVARFGTGRVGPIENYGPTQSVRVHYEHGLEVEFGIDGLEWAALPLDPATAQVFKDGIRILFDPEGQLDRAIRSLTG